MQIRDSRPKTIYILEAHGSIPAGTDIASEDNQQMISVVILNFNKPFLTNRSSRLALKSASFSSQEVEVMVVDNGSSTVNKLLGTILWPIKLRKVFLRVNVFFGEGNNIGAEAARGDFLLLLNNDTLLEKDSIQKLHELFVSRKNEINPIGAVAPTFLHENGSVQEFGGFVSDAGKGYRNLDGEPQSTLKNFEVIEADYASAACLFIPRELFLGLLGFEYRYMPAYYEDTDLCFKIRSTGRRILVSPLIRVRHLDHATNKLRRNHKVIKGSPEKNQSIFRSIWGSPPSVSKGRWQFELWSK